MDDLDLVVVVVAGLGGVVTMVVCIVFDLDLGTGEVAAAIDLDCVVLGASVGGLGLDSDCVRDLNVAVEVCCLQGIDPLASHQHRWGTGGNLTSTDLQPALSGGYCYLLEHVEGNHF